MDGLYSWSVASFFVIVCLVDSVIASKNDVSEVRYQEVMFQKSTQIFNQTVTCEKVETNAKFPSDTWSCHNIRIGGKKLRHLFLYHESQCDSDKRDKKDKKDVHKGKNDVGALCRAMMKAHGIHRELWAAFIHKPQCNVKKEKMMMLQPMEDVQQPLQWHEAPSRGYATTLRCMATD